MNELEKNCPNVLKVVEGKCVDCGKVCGLPVKYDGKCVRCKGKEQSMELYGDLVIDTPAGRAVLPASHFKPTGGFKTVVDGEEKTVSVFDYDPPTNKDAKADH